MTDTAADTTSSDAQDLPDFRRLPVPEAIAWLGEHGEPIDPRTDIDTDSLRRRFPQLAKVETENLEAEGPHGRVPLRLYRDGSARPTGRALVWVHGGAFIGGDLDMPESNWVALELAARGIPVLAVDYTKCLNGAHFPVPSDDVLAAWHYALNGAAELFGVPADAVILGGASAGGNLVAGATARLRDADEPLPTALLLVYPALHPDGAHPDADPAAVAESDAPFPQLSLNFAGSPELLADPHVFPGLGSAERFPPTFILVCENDELRPSGEAFAARLGKAGVDVTLHLEPGAGHGHINEPSDPAAPRTIDAMAGWLTR